MGFFSGILGGALGRAISGKRGNQARQLDPTKPGHVHGRDSGGTTTTGTTKELGDSRFDPIKGDIPRQDPSFMGKGQVDQFSSLIDPSSVDPSGRAISSQELDPVGIETAMNPPLATPVQDVDEIGVNSLY